ncbi:hypothetical protein Droror1_Dr00000872 [Drosera rotundifolia]
MTDANRGRGRGRGRGQGEEEPRHRDQRDLEIAAMGRRIRELERQLAEARVGSTNGEEGEESDTIDSSEAGDEDEGFNPWGNPNRGRNQRFRPGPDPSFQILGVKIDIPEFEEKKPTPSRPPPPTTTTPPPQLSTTIILPPTRLT